MGGGVNLGVGINGAAAGCDPAKGRCFPARPQHHGAVRQAGPGLGQRLSSHIHPETPPRMDTDPRRWAEEAAAMTRNGGKTDPRRRLEGNLFPPIDSRASAPSSRGSPPGGGGWWW